MKQKPIPEKIREFEKHMTKQFAENRLVFERLNSIDERIGLLEIKKQLDIRKEKVQPYTAMRSTRLEEEDLIFRPHATVKPYIKPQEDMREKIASNLWYMFSHSSGIWHYLKEEQKTNWFVKADKILAIVKGE